MGRKRVPLGNYVTEYSVRNKGDEDIPVYSVTNSQGFCTDYFDKEVASKDKKTYKIVPKGYFAYNPSRINVGSVDWQKYEERVIVSPLYNVFSVSENLEQQYLFYFLRSDIGKQMIKSKVSGSVRDNLKIDMLKEMTIPEMSIEEQKKCVHILDTLKIIISLRKKELDKLDNLIKARFVDMFGDVVTNKKKWSMNTFGEICRVRQGLQIPISKRLISYEVGCYEYITVQYINGGKGREYIKNPKSTVICTEDDILMTRTGNTGKVITGVRGVFHNNFFLIDFDREKYNKEFIVHYLNLDFIQADIIRRAGVSTIPDLNHGEFYNIKIFEPPIFIQNEFATFVEHVNKSKLITYYHHKSIYTKPQLCCKMVVVNDFLNAKRF